MIFAILPVKNPKHAKQRLRALLDAGEREMLARLLFRQTLAALHEARGIDRIVVVTDDAATMDHARDCGAIVWQEKEQVSHSVSADAACLRAKSIGATTVLLVPIDVPLVTAEDFSRLAAGAKPGLLLVPSMDGTGTNALVRTPPDVIESRFGPGSCRAHLDLARSKGVPAEVLRFPGLMFDIDTPEDAAELLLRAPESSVAEFLRMKCTSK